jgi:tetratricopeptide (TPR) repeat protein
MEVLPRTQPMPLTRQLITVLVVATAAAATWSCTHSSDTPTADATGQAACRVALAAASARDDADRDIARLQDEIRRGRNDVHALEQLGYRYVARARVRGDEGDYTLAEHTADCLLARQPDSASALLLRGHVRHQTHHFDDAEAIARQLVGRRQFVLDYGLLGDALMEQGRVTEAAAAYQQMVDIKPFYQSYTRAAHLRWLRGDLDGAVELMRMAVAAASPRDPESLAWGYSRLAAYEMQAGRLDEAEHAAEAALGYQEDYAAALLAQGRVRLALGRPNEAVDSFRLPAQRKPVPEFQWALADALRLVERTADAKIVEDELRRDGTRTDPRTLALFLATRGTGVEEAVALAEHELTARADVFTLDAMAWALAAAGRVAEAEPFMTRALAEGTEDGRLFLHAAAIAAAAGQPADARRWIDKTDRLRPMLLPSELDELAALHLALSTQEN